MLRGSRERPRPRLLVEAFVGGSSCGVAAIGSAGGPSGSAGGDDEVEEQQGIATELFVLFFYSLIH